MVPLVYFSLFDHLLSFLFSGTHAKSVLGRSMDRKFEVGAKVETGNRILNYLFRYNSRYLHLTLICTFFSQASFQIVGREKSLFMARHSSQMAFGLALYLTNPED